MEIAQAIWPARFHWSRFDVCSSRFLSLSDLRFHRQMSRSRLRRRRSIAECAVGPHAVVMLTPLLDHDLMIGGVKKRPALVPRTHRTLNRRHTVAPGTPASKLQLAIAHLQTVLSVTITAYLALEHQASGLDADIATALRRSAGDVLYQAQRLIHETLIILDHSRTAGSKRNR